MHEGGGGGGLYKSEKKSLIGIESVVAPDLSICSLMTPSSDTCLLIGCK